MTYIDFDFYRGKRVFVTGHTGFKGSWLCRILILAGAKVTGYGLEPPTDPNLFSLSGIGKEVRSVIGDIRNFSSLREAFNGSDPEIVVHLAAQPIVREGYKSPVYTYETNVMGTVNVLECIRQYRHVKSFLNITTDKVYQNNEWVWGYRENETLNGHDPYSNSKSCSELVTHCYKKNFFTDGFTAISTARAGNVIGGGDFAKDRIIPDCVRAVLGRRPVFIRNPNSTRPYQHVLESLFAYLMILQRQYQKPSLSGCYNIGPEDHDCVSTEKLVSIFGRKWGEDFEWITQPEVSAPHEVNFLKLDCSKLKKTFGWQPRWHVDEAVQKTVDWTKVWLSGGNILEEMDRQISEYMTGSKWAQL